MFLGFILLSVVSVTAVDVVSPNEDDIILFDNSQGLGRQFDGVGGLSGGGATSKLLVNYPVKQLDEILDYLFKPNFGASLQILKVEIGGDIQSTDGTESSHMHYSWDENYERGYEWWLMSEAKKRNPDIKLYGLPWGFPGWVGQGTQNPYIDARLTADYIVRWIAAAKTFYNLTIDYIGIWNERGYSIDYIKILRKTLDERGFLSVLIVASDNHWEIVNDLKNDAEFASAVDIIGAHYPGTNSTQDAVNTGKQIWSSEDFNTFNDEIGGGCWARVLNQNYVNGLMTSTIAWNLIASYYRGLAYYKTGLMTALQPWSGNYLVQTPIWISAHTTQFTSIGWNYLKHGQGVGKLPKGGSYVALISPDGQHLTVVIETMSHNHSVCIRPELPSYEVYPQTVTLSLKGSLSSIQELNVWYTKLYYDGSSDITFQKQNPIKFTNGQAILNLGLDEVLTLTTITTGFKGSYPDPPLPQPFPLPYTDNFETYKLHQEPNNLAQQTGAYEVLSDGQNKFIRQMVLDTPVAWCVSDLVNKSLSVIGDYDQWTNVFVEIDFNIPQVNGTSGVCVGARLDRGGCETHIIQGIFFFVLFDGTFQLTNDFARTKVIKEGTLSQQPGWHTFSLLVQGNRAIGVFDRNVVFNSTIPNLPTNGFAGIGTDSYGLADFDNLYLAIPA